MAGSLRSPRVVAGLGAVVAAALGLGGLGRPAGAEDARPPWAADLEALRLEGDPSKRLEKSWALLAKKPEVEALRLELLRPLPWKKDAPTDMTHWERELGKTGKLTVFAYVPKAYVPEKAWPVLVWMHGAVMRDEDGRGLAGLGLVREAAEERGFIVLSPSATKDTVWWSPAGTDHLRACLAECARRYHVDPNRVAAAGFSDGGSGCFHLGLHDPDPYACFLALMGNPVVTRLVGGPAFAGNAASRPVWAVNGGQDPLYPAVEVEPLVDELKQTGVVIEWKALPEAGHDPTAVADEIGAMEAFWKAHPREALPKQVDWECTVPAIDGRRAWVEMLTLAPSAPGAEDLPTRPLALPQVAPRPRLGISVDRAFEGAGIRIEEVQKDTPAAEAGLKAGDVLLKAGGVELPAGQEALQLLRAYLDGLEGKDGEFTVKRGEETLTLKTKPRVLASDAPPADLGYGKPSGRVLATVTGPNRIEVKTRGVSSLRLHLARPLVDPAQDLVVRLNGKEVFRGKVKPEAAYLLAQALSSLPGDPLFEAQLTLTP